MKTSLPIIAVLTLVAAILTGGCGEQESDGPTQSQTAPPKNQADGLSLLGLVNGLTLNYLQTDTVILVDSTYSVSVTTSVLNIEISGSEPEFLISSNRVRWLNFRVTDHNILQNGFWKITFSRDSLYYFPEPPAVMPREITDSIVWTGFLPSYADDAARIFYNSYFGFFFSKQLVGKVRLRLPAGEFDCFRFDIKLFDDRSMENPVVRVSEYYSAGVGLVKQTLVGGSLKRTLSLTGYLQPTTEN